MENSKIKLESPFNSEDGSLPYFYVKPNTPLEWICGYDSEGKILSIFKAPMNDKPAFMETYMNDDNNFKDDKEMSSADPQKRAKIYKERLIKDGWKKGKIDIQIKNKK